jgi:hypothetical protein
MDFIKNNWWLILLFTGAVGFMGYSSIVDMSTHDLLQKKFLATPKEIKSDMINAVDKNENIDKLLKKIMVEMKSDRAYVFQFHNGTRLVSGKHFYYYSNTHEVVMPGISAEIANLQMLPISILVTSWLPDLLRDKSFMQLTKDEKHEYSKKILEDQGIVCVAIMPLMDKTDTYPIGFMGVDFVKSKINKNALKIMAKYKQSIREMIWK